MECEEAVLCEVCFHSSHLLSECPFVEFSTNVEPSYAEAAAKEGQAATTPRGKRTPKQLEAMRAAAEATKKKTAEKAKQCEKEREEKQ